MTLPFLGWTISAIDQTDRQKHSQCASSPEQGQLPSGGIITRRRRSEERRVGKECRSRWSPYLSSRRRHTRCLSDWSSDVCSSDLRIARNIPNAPPAQNRANFHRGAL